MNRTPTCALFIVDKVIVIFQGHSRCPLVILRPILADETDVFKPNDTFAEMSTIIFSHLLDISFTLYMPKDSGRYLWISIMCVIMCHAK